MAKAKQQKQPTVRAEYCYVKILEHSRVAKFSRCRNYNSLTKQNDKNLHLLAFMWCDEQVNCLLWQAGPNSAYLPL